MTLISPCFNATDEGENQKILATSTQSLALRNKEVITVKTYFRFTHTIASTMLGKAFPKELTDPKALMLPKLQGLDLRVSCQDQLTMPEGCA